MRSGSRRCPRSSATAPWSSNRHQRFHRRRADRKDFMLGDLDRGGEHYMGTAKRSLPTANKGEGHGWTGYCHRQWRPDRPGHFGHSLRQVRERHGRRIASVIHLAAYFDLTGEPNPKYEQVTIRGTERPLRKLQEFEVEQFVFASTMLVHAPGGHGKRINEDWPLDPKLPYRESKIRTEALIRKQRGAIPAV